MISNLERRTIEKNRKIKKYRVLKVKKTANYEYIRVLIRKAFRDSQEGLSLLGQFLFN
jgi:hypothetical protein